jgi:hypothetical protein
MPDNKDVKKDQKPKEQKPLTNPGDIKGKIEVTDTRERRDGPGGNLKKKQSDRIASFYIKACREEEKGPLVLRG